MTYAALFFCLGFIWYAAAMTLASALAVPFLRAAMRVDDPSVRAAKLVRWRALPTIAAGVVTAGGFVPAFLWLEPRQTTENVTSVMGLLTLLAGTLALVGIARGIAAFWVTRRLVDRWERTARPVSVPGAKVPAFAVEESFPVAAVVGWRRPTLFFARNVLASLSAAELAAVAAHEMGHVGRGDHWKRLLMRAAPDVLSLTAVGAEVERSWQEAAEQMADEHATIASPGRALDLASALIKVARLAARSTVNQEALPLNALYRGDGIAARVQRLLRARTASAAPPKPAPFAAPLPELCLALIATVLVVGLVVTCGGDALHRVHALAETIVVALQ